jgi:predicted enzyme related to lactoylglutathione lyase
MTKDSFKIAKITLAVTNTEKMVAFYGNVYKCEFREIRLNGTKLYSGELAGLKILLCPNTLAGVKAEQSRHQFEYIVNDLDQVVRAALAAGGSLQGKVDITPQHKIATILDPDGNTTVFIQELE